MARCAYWLATFFGAGLSPKAPGTAGTLASFILWAPLVYLQIHWVYFLAIILGVFILGIWACKESLQFFTAKDPQAIVIDEVVGQGIALVLCPPQLVYLFAAFVLFRFFDITKIWPASYADKRLAGAWGIMLDDVIAGVYAFGLMKILETYFA